MRPIVLFATALSLVGCATDSGKPPVCDGRHLRPANPYGSTLSPAPQVQPTTKPAPAAAAPTSAKPHVAPKGCGA
jgi:hypothetical protein